MVTVGLLGSFIITTPHRGTNDIIRIDKLKSIKNIVSTMKKTAFAVLALMILIVGVATAQDVSASCPFGEKPQELNPGDCSPHMEFTSEIVGASVGGHVVSSTSSVYSLNSNLVGTTMSLSRDLLTSSGTTGFAQTVSAESNVYKPVTTTEYAVAFADDGVGFVGHATGGESTLVDFITSGVESEDVATCSACDTSLMGSSFHISQGAIASAGNMNVVLAEGGMPMSHDYTVLIAGLPDSGSEFAHGTGTVFANVHTMGGLVNTTGSPQMTDYSFATVNTMSNKFTLGGSFGIKVTHGTASFYDILANEVVPLPCL